MTTVIVDETLKSKLHGLEDQIELCDASGQKLGHYLPAALYRAMLNAWVETIFTKEGLERAEVETSGRPLAEIWKSLGRS